MKRSYTISAFTENSPGVLHRITVLFTRRKMNIESLTVSETETHGISRFTIVLETTEELIRTIVKQLNRIIEVVDVYAAENRELIYKEIALFKINTDSSEKRKTVEDVSLRHGADIVMASDDYVIVEKTGTEDEIRSLYLIMQPHGIREFLRSGRVAMLRHDRADSSIIS